MESGDHSRIVRFGPFEADLGTGELSQEGTRLALQGQPFQVLAILLKHSGELVTRSNFVPSDGSHVTALARGWNRSFS